MLKHWIIASLIGATAIVPVGASAADRESNGRWGDHQSSSRPAEDRRDNGRAYQRGLDGQPALRPAQQQGWRNNNVVRDQPRETKRDQRQDWNSARVDQRRDWRNDRQDDRKDWRKDNRDDRRDWRDARVDNRRDWSEDRRDNRRDWRNDRRDDRRDWARSDWKRDDHRDWRHDRRDWRHDRYSWNHDWRHNKRYDWQYYRSRHNHVYRAPRYYAPYGWDYGYRRFSIGVTLFSGLYGSSYWIDDPWYYRLPPAYGSLRWVRYYDDALLVDVRTGEVVDVINDFFW